MTLSSTGEPSTPCPILLPLLTSASLNFSHFSHVDAIVIGSFLLTGAVAAVAMKLRSRREEVPAERKSAQGKLPLNLVALSSAAVLAVYAAGYWRTQSAEEQYVRQAALRRESSAPAIYIAPPPSSDASASFAAPPSEPAASPRKKNRARADAQHRFAIDAPTPPPTAGPAGTSPPPGGVPVGLPTDDPAVLAGNPIQGDNSSPAPPSSPAPQAVYKDGTFFGWGRSRHGDIQAAVTIKKGRIVTAEIASCWTRYSCSVIDPLLPQVISRQSANVDNVSGATESTDAFFGAVSDALSKAK